jgi:glycosyltransferase involved in cell wall biosynthesis
MRACMVSYSVYEADGRVMRYAEALAQRGDSVDVIALSRGDRSGNEVVNGVNVFRVMSRDRREKSKFTYLYRILAFFLRAMWLVTRRHRQQPYDLIHVHSVPDFLVFLAWIPKLKGAKIVLDIHDVMPEFYASKFNGGEESVGFKVLLYLERKSARFADYVIAANHIWEAKLLSRSAVAGKCTALLNFPDRSMFQRKGRTRSLEDDKFIILYPGTLNWHQGLDIAIRSFARIKDQAPNSEFHIYGMGPTQDSLRELAKSLGLNGRVKFQGSCQIKEVAGIMENADLGVVPKRNDPFGDEAFSTKILEFMAMGVPVVVSETKIDRYYFNDDLVKFFTAGDDESLAAAMLNVIQNEGLRKTLVQNSSSFVEKYDWQTNKAKYFEIVDALCSQNAGQS